MNPLSLFFILCSWAIGALLMLYAAFFLRKDATKWRYLLYAVLSLLCATCAFSTTNFIHFLIFWGSLLVLLYLILALNTFQVAGKALLIVGFGDLCLILGIALLAILKTPSMNGFVPLPLDNFLHGAIFSLLAIAALVKIGVFGFHDWIIDAAKAAPSITLAFLPASLDKFLGVYLLLRLCKDFFILNQTAMIILMAIGAVSIFLAVFLALVQHDLKSLLAYHAVSQAGYMVLGIGSVTIFGMAGGLFHMLNNTIYKSALFLTAGNLEYRLGKTELSQLGGLNKLMPFTFFSTMVTALAISGIPPLNGFVSKWMIYQGLIPREVSLIGVFKIIFLILAMFGSALTLASFIKVIYCPFFSEKPKALPGKTKEAPFLLLLPQIFLALSCVVLGIFANFIIAKFIYLLSPGYSAKIMPSGVWQADLASALIFIGIICGVLFYWLMRKPVRKSETFIGGEDLPDKRIEGTDFYLTIKETPLLKTIYAQAEENGLSIYPLGAAIIKAMANFCYYCIDRFLNLITNAVGKLIFVFSWILKKIHNGLLDRYVAWVLLGAIIIMGVLFKCWNCM